MGNRAVQQAANTETGTDRITVILIPQAAADLAEACEMTGLNKTDNVNRAIHFYNWVIKVTAAGAQLMVQEPGGDPQVVILL